MEIKKISEYIIGVLTNITNITNMSVEDTEIAKFIDDLSDENDVTSIRLLICIAIDCKNSIKEFGLVEAEGNVFVTNIRRCILLASRCSIKLKSLPKGLPNRWKFAWAQNEINLEERKPCLSCNNETDYSRIYNFKSYLLWVVDVNREHNLGVDKVIDTDEEINRLYTKFYSGKMSMSCKVARLGKDRFVFIAVKDEVKDIGYLNVLEIIDSLGLYTQDAISNEIFVCLEYDSSFSDNSWQPDSLTGDWGNIRNNDMLKGNDYFLSYLNHDRFGRTYSISGYGKQLKERVHMPFNHNGIKTYHMTAINLGVPLNIIEKGRSEDIILEAINRFNKA